MVDMVKGNVTPACIDYQNDLAQLLERKKTCGGYDTLLEDYLLRKISTLCACLLEKLTALEKVLLESKKERKIFAHASFYRDKVLFAMSELRLIVDELETLVAKKYWSLPVYRELLYSVV
jgi:glutamine synthetase